jgi:acetolactate synthase-1/2/3 large subunit
VVVLLMNDGGYGVIRNIQDAHYGGRHCYVDLHTPDFAALAGSIQLPFIRLSDLGKAPAAFAEAKSRKGPTLIELDMKAIGPFKTAFAGPPVKKEAASA